MSERKLRKEAYGAEVKCAVCFRAKTPLGRSAPMGLYLCDHECSGYYLNPQPASLWPGESEADFGYPVSDAGVEFKEAK